MAVIPKSNIKFPDGTSLQDVYDNAGGGASASGTNETTFTIDEDNISGTAAITELRYSRGATTDDAFGIIQWNEASGPYFELLKLNAGDTAKYKASIMVDKIYIGDTNTYIYKDANGNMVFHVATGKNIKFEEG
jgi:hypothetical protein